MSAVARGAKNAFRSGVKASAVILILAISLGLALSMLVANQAIKERLQSVRQSIGTKIIVNPAGSSMLQGGGEPLKTEDVDKMRSVANVADVSSILHVTMTTAGGNNQNGPRAMIVGGGAKAGETNLESSIDPGTLGKRAAGGVNAQAIKLPVRAVGLGGAYNEEGRKLSMSSGRFFEAGDDLVAIVGKGLAQKNNLSIGSTFTAYDQTIKVVGVFEADTQFANDTLYLPLSTAQRLSESGGEISSALAFADSVENVEAVIAGIKDVLGKDKVDVSSSDPNATAVIESLKTVEKISFLGFIGALITATVVIFFTMIMIVRERRREIGVLKAIGAGNFQVVTQFVVEAICLVVIAAVIGFGIATLSSNAIAEALVGSIDSAQAQGQPTDPKFLQTGGSFKSVQIGGPNVNVNNAAKDLVGNVTTNVGVSTLAVGLLAALLIAVVGSAIPAWLVTKVRPAEVLRGE